MGSDIILYEETLMPKQLTLWKCSKCYTTHDTEEAAIKCEKSHAFIGSMNIIEVSKCTFGVRYPDGIIISDGHGEVAEYEKIREAVSEDFYQGEDSYFEQEK
jgi:hypothetical protein